MLHVFTSAPHYIGKENLTKKVIRPSPRTMQLMTKSKWYLMNDMQCMGLHLTRPSTFDAKTLKSRYMVRMRHARCAFHLRHPGNTNPHITLHFHWVWGPRWGLPCSTSLVTPLGCKSTLSFLSQWSNKQVTPSRLIHIQLCISGKKYWRGIFLYACMNDCKKETIHLLFYLVMK